MARAFITTAAVLICCQSATAANNLRSSARRLTDAHGWSTDPAEAQMALDKLAATTNGKLQTHDAVSAASDGVSIEPITGCFIVNMKDGPVVQSRSGAQFDTDGRDSLIADLINANDDVSAQGITATIGYQYSDAQNGFAFCGSELALEQVLDNEEVDVIEQDMTVQLDDPNPDAADQASRHLAVQRNAIWGLDRIDGKYPDKQYNYGNLDGSGMDVYVIDTGVNTRHTEYASRLKGGKGFVNDGKGYEDCNGHGTHCAGTVLGTKYGVAKQANLYGVRVLGCSGSGSNSGILAGVNWSVENARKTGRPSVLSMSLGGGYSASSNRAVAGAKSAGLVVVVAAGNENTDACRKSPASEKSVITVGSSTSSDRRSSFSNYGSCVDIFAPGSSIKSAWIGGSTRTNTISGTSMATPHVAGAAALELQMMAREGAGTSPDAVWSRMKRRAQAGKISDTKNAGSNLLLIVSTENTPARPTPRPTPLPGNTCGTEGGAVSGQRCAFPFTLRGVVYNSCTSVDDPDGKLWCSTKTDAAGKHMKGNWGHCNAACTNPKPNPTPAPTPNPFRPVPVPNPFPTPAPGTCVTVDQDKGRACVFPFKHRGKTYNGCTTDSDPDNRLWCSTQTDASGNHITGKGKWGHCSAGCTDKPRPNPNPAPTPNPFRPAPVPNPAPRPTPPPAPPAGKTLWEMWTNLPGDGVDALVTAVAVRGLTQPTRSETRDSISMPVGAGLQRSSGSRLTTTFTVGSTGDFGFYLSSGGAAELWVASKGDRGAAELERVAFVPAAGAGENEFSRYASQISAPVRLTKGVSYTMRILHKSGASGGGEPRVQIARKFLGNSGGGNVDE